MSYAVEIIRPISKEEILELVHAALPRNIWEGWFSESFEISCGKHKGTK
jgi:hypothetical protein